MRLLPFALIMNFPVSVSIPLCFASSALMPTEAISGSVYMQEGITSKVCLRLSAVHKGHCGCGLSAGSVSKLQTDCYIACRVHSLFSRHEPVVGDDASFFKFYVKPFIKQVFRIRYPSTAQSTYCPDTVPSFPFSTILHVRSASFFFYFPYL